VSAGIDAVELDIFSNENELTREAQLAQALTQLPEIYYAGKAGYWMRKSNTFIPLTGEAQVKQHLLGWGVSKEALLELLCYIREHRYVAHVGSIAGYTAGLHVLEDCGLPVLVKQPPSIIGGAVGGFPFLDEFLEELLGDQKEIALAHLRQARRNLLDGQRRPLPALALVGPRSCGKTLFIEICRKSLGGRSANAFSALNGEQFNADVAAAELLVIDDEIASKDHRARTTLAQGIKNYVFAASVRLRAMYHEAIQVRPIQMIVIAVNDEEEHMQVLPVIDDSMADKITLLRCTKAKLQGLTDREKIGKIISSELPAFVGFLDSSSHPKQFRDQRTGVLAWHNPDLLGRLQALSVEQRFRELLLQSALVTEEIKSKGSWTGTATELENLLTLHWTETAQAARSLLRWQGACGTYLGRLRDRGGSNIDKKTVNGTTKWEIREI